MEEQVKAALEKAGKNVSDEAIEEFCRYMRENDENPQIPKKMKKKAKAKKRSLKMGPSSQNPGEMEQWESRIASWEDKVQLLDSQLQACQNVHNPAGSPLSREIQYTQSRDTLSAYPCLRSERVGQGFIHPPTYQESCRSRFPIYRKEMCYPPPYFVQQLRESERKPKPYTPEERNDAERWRIKERIIYSHPDYFIRSK